jgi:hypothetical protein
MKMNRGRLDSKWLKKKVDTKEGLMLWLSSFLFCLAII